MVGPTAFFSYNFRKPELKLFHFTEQGAQSNRGMQPSAASLVSCDLEPVHEIVKLHFPVLVHGSLFFVTQIPSVTLAVISPERDPFSVSKAPSEGGLWLDSVWCWGLQGRCSAPRLPATMLHTTVILD